MNQTDYSLEAGLSANSEGLLRRSVVFSTALYLIRTKNIKQVRDTFLQGAFGDGVPGSGAAGKLQSAGPAAGDRPDPSASGPLRPYGISHTGRSPVRIGGKSEILRRIRTVHTAFVRKTFGIYPSDHEGTAGSGKSYVRSAKKRMTFFVIYFLFFLFSFLGFHV